MPNGSSYQSIIDQFDQILEDDSTLSTRTGLRFAMSVLRESVTILADMQKQFSVIEKRVADIEKIHETERAERQKRLEAQQWTLRVIVGGALATIVMLVANGIIFLLSTIPLVRTILEAAQP